MRKRTIFPHLETIVTSSSPWVWRTHLAGHSYRVLEVQNSGMKSLLSNERWHVNQTNPRGLLSRCAEDYCLFHSPVRINELP